MQGPGSVGVVSTCLNSRAQPVPIAEDLRTTNRVYDVFRHLATLCVMPYLCLSTRVRDGSLGNVVIQWGVLSLPWCWAERGVVV